MDESDQTHKDIKQTSKEFSFSVVTHAIQLEEVMTTIICLELAKEWNKVDDFIDHFDRVNLDNKITLAEIILKSNHSHILKKFPNIFAEIREIKDLRNNLAHRNRHYLGSVNDSEFKFVLSHRKINKQLEFTKSEMVIQIKKIETCIKDVWEIQNLFAQDFGYKGIV